MSSILPLAPDAISQIHSSKHITSLQHVVWSLLENSLDADATKVDITIDFSRGCCAVEDNGTGIPFAEFEERGGLGKLYHTSKHDVTSTGKELHGRTGTFLASVGALCLLSISSCRRASTCSADITFHRGKVVGRRTVLSGDAEAGLSTGHGTVVTVKDLFGNMPVRVKQRALNEENTGDEKAWQELKLGAVALSLAWPRPCAVRIRDVNAAGRHLSLAAAHPAVSSALTEKHLNQLAGKTVKSALKDSLPILFQAGLASTDTRNGWVSVKASARSVSVRGFICLVPAPTRQCQFVSIGVHPCSSSSGHNDLYEIVNKTFANSSFGTVEEPDDLDDGEKDRRLRDRRYKNDGYVQRQLQSKKGVDKWPMFVLRLSFNDSGRQTASMENVSDSSLKAMVDLLEATTQQWLTANHFRPRKKRQRKNGLQQGPLSASSSPDRSQALAKPGVSTPLAMPMGTTESASTSKKRKLEDLSGRGAPFVSFHNFHSTYFSGLSRIKSGSGAFYDKLWDPKPATAPAGRSESKATVPAARPKTAFKLASVEAGELSARPPTAMVTRNKSASMLAPTNQNEQRLSSDDFGSVDEDGLITAVQAVENAEGPSSTEQQSLADDVVAWTDPVTKQVYRVNSRTGVVLPTIPKHVEPEAEAETGGIPPRSRQSGGINLSLSSAGKPLSLARRTRTPADRPESRWLPGFLKQWDNPVFERQDEERIPVATFDGPGLEVAEMSKHRCTQDLLHDHFSAAGTSDASKLSKAQLKQARVVKQVDAKFILCIFPSDAQECGERLVLIDQHAASERIILEKLLRELCEPVHPTSQPAISTNLDCTSTVRTTILERPLRFQVSTADGELLRQQAPHFARWGILYDIKTTSHNTTATPPSFSQPRRQNEQDPVALTVRSLPLGIAERVTLFPNLIIKLLRTECWVRAQDGRPRLPRANAGSSSTSPKGASEDQQSWLKSIGSCPKGIIEMLNSRACRSAVMFNDVLSKAECEQLVEELGQCVFPFMCAHGRVSMVPVVELGGELGGVGGFGCGRGDGGKRKGGGVEGFMEAFRRWRGGGG
jgi:DNA mismatch repair protein MLH3